MRGFIYKNVILYRSEIYIIAFFQLLCSSIAILVSVSAKVPPMLSTECLALFFCVFLCAALFDNQLFVPDEKKSVSSFILSTPNGARNHVASKYIVIFLVNIAILLACTITDLVACAACNTFSDITISMSVLFFCLSILYSSFSNPFYLRYGLVAGNSVKYGVIGVLALFLAGYMLFGDTSFLEEGAFITKIMEIAEKWKASRLLAVVLPLTLLLNFLSYRLSVVLYKKGAEKYEE